MNHPNATGYSAGRLGRTMPRLEAINDRLAPSVAPISIPPEAAFAGVMTPVRVAAFDADNQAVRNFAGSVARTNSDSVARTYTYTSADHGIHVFSETFAAAGSATLKAVETGNAAVPALAAETVDAAAVATHLEARPVEAVRESDANGLIGTATVNVNAARTATHLGLVVQCAAYPGGSTKLVVVALDASNQVVKDFTGTVKFTSSDNAAQLPAEYAFTAADHGVHVFSATLKTSGKESITATDVDDGSLSGTASVDVTAFPRQRLNWTFWF